MEIPASVPLDHDGQYCLNCFSGPVSRVFQNNLTFYHCANCDATLERSLVIDGVVKWWIDEKRTYWHESVGVAVINEKNEILCILRQIYPFAYALPAGHLDVGEDPADAASRELHEEIGVSIKTPLEHVLDVDIPGDSCRRGSDDHRWHLYRTRIRAEVPLNVSDEASSAKWFSISDLQKEKKLVYPLRFILDLLGEKLVAE